MVSDIDHNGNLGYAIAVVTFTGVAGTTYVAKGSHSAVAVIQDYALPPAGQPTQYEYLDEYNFGEFDSRPIIYPDSYQWDGPGPPEQRRASAITIGGTMTLPPQNVALRACLRSSKQQPEECQVDHLQAGVQLAFAVLP
jgi:hypothetical protein